MLATTGNAVSSACRYRLSARCHDHKFDPGFPQADYYRLLSAPFTTTVRTRSRAAQPSRTRSQAIEGALIASEGLARRSALHTQGDDFFKQSYFLRRGDVNQKSGRAAAGLPAGADSRHRRTARNTGPRRPPKGSRTWAVSPHGPGRLAHRHAGRGRAARRAGDRQSPLAASFRARHRRHAERFRHAGRTALASRAARLARWRTDPSRLAAQADPAPDPDERRVPRKQRGRPREGNRRSDQPLLLASREAAAGGRGRPRRSLGVCQSARRADVRPRLARRGPIAAAAFISPSSGANWCR